MIARDEENRIGRALASFAGVADEIIVTDTGSTDRTVEIAESYGAKVSFFPWIDDFAAARNYALSQANGDWIFWLDADEELLPDSRAELQKCMNVSDAVGFSVQRQDLMFENLPDQFTIMWQLRLFRRLPELKFIGRCHPDFQPPLTETAQRLGMRLYSSHITMRHDGFIHSLRPVKLKRAAHLLELELRDRPGQFYYLVEYGRTLLALGDPKGHDILRQAAQLMLADRHAERQKYPLAAALLEYLLRTPRELTQCPLTRQELLNLSKRWFPDSAPLIWLEAQDLFETGNFPEAAVKLEKLLAMGSDLSYNQMLNFDPRIIGDEARLNLGVCYLRMAELEKAEEIFNAMTESPTVGAQAKANLAVIVNLRRRFST